MVSFKQDVKYYEFIVATKQIWIIIWSIWQLLLVGLQTADKQDVKCLCCMALLC